MNAVIRVLRVSSDMNRRTIFGNAFAFLFLLVLVIAAGLRTAWTFGLQSPYLQSDSRGYVAAMHFLTAPYIDEYRTAGVPVLLASALSLAGSPLGILIMNNLLWLLSTLAITLGILRVTESRVLSILLLVYLAFAHKNLAFEYLLMSEHYSRVIFLLFFAFLLVSYGRGDELWRVCVFSVLITFNVLIKPSAVILMPVVIVYYGIEFRRVFPNRDQCIQILRNCLIVVGVIVMTLIGYGSLFERNYGSFGLSHFTGHNLFSHVGHLTNLEGPRHVEIKKDLRDMLARYREKYVTLDEYQPNWLVHGSLNEKLKADFEGHSPARVIWAHVGATRREKSSERPFKPGLTDAKAVDLVFKELAIEGILSNPKSYLFYVVNRTFFLVQEGFSFDYSDYLSMPSLARHALDRVVLKQWLSGDFVRVSEARESAMKAGNCSDGQSACISGDDYPRYLELATILYDRMKWPAEWIAQLAPYLIWLGAVAFVISPVRNISREAVGCAFILGGLVLIGYVLFLGMLNTSEALRFMANIQDFIQILALLGVIILARSISHWTGKLGQRLS